MLFEVLHEMIIGAVVFPYALGIQCLYENEKTATNFGSCIQMTQKGEVVRSFLQ